MDLKKTNAQVTIFFMLLFASLATFGGIQDNDLAKAIQLYDESNYEEAEKVLKNLLDEKPDHLMINYYYGACRTENGHYGTNEIIYLLNGSTGESPLRTNYYLGVQYHAKNRWEEALKHYTRFKATATSEELQHLGLSTKIQQCYEKTNPFVSKNEMLIADVHPAALERENEIEEYIPLQSNDSTHNGFDTIAAEDTIAEAAVVRLIAKTPAEKPKTTGNVATINFIIDGEITYLDSAHFKTNEGAKHFRKARKKQKELDDRIVSTDRLRQEYGEAASYAEKQALGERILAGETDIYALQNETNRLMMQAKQEEINYWAGVSPEEKKAFLEELQAYHFKTDQPETEDIEYDTTAYIDPTLLMAGAETNPVSEEKTDDELIYKIQLGAYSRGLPTYVKNTFKKLSYIRKIENYTDEKGIVVYTTGNLSNYEDAVVMQNQVRQEGVEDAFVVPYFNGKRITLKEAKEIEAGK